MTPKTLALWLALAALPGIAVAAGKAHEHGAARLDVAIEGTRVTLGLEAPLDNLLGFERAPRNAAEKQAADAAVATLKAADRLFKFDPAAGCALTGVTLASAALGLGDAKAEPGDEHADIDAEFVFTCQDASQVAGIDVGLFDAFKRLQRLDVQVATARGQFKQTLKRGAARIALKR